MPHVKCNPQKKTSTLASITHYNMFQPLNIIYCTMIHMFLHMLVSSTAVRTPGTKQELQGYQLPLSYTMSRRNVQVCHKNKKKTNKPNQEAQQEEHDASSWEEVSPQKAAYLQVVTSSLACNLVRSTRTKSSCCQ